MKSKLPRRNIYPLLAKMRRGGPMRDKRLKRAEENKHPEFFEESSDERPFDLFDSAKKIAQGRKQKDSSCFEDSKQELFLMKNILLNELNKLYQKDSNRGELNITLSEREFESITLWAGEDYKIISFTCNVQRGIYDGYMKPHVWAHMYEFGSDEFADCTQCAYSVKDMPKFLKEVAEHLSKWM